MHDAMYKICYMPICIRYLLQHFKKNAFVDMHIAMLHLWIFEDHLLYIASYKRIDLDDRKIFR